jgi:hypothetical protein
MRKKNPKRAPCGCDAYHFPHRKGSGRCGNLFQQTMDATPEDERGTVLERFAIECPDMIPHTRDEFADVPF